MVQCLDIIFVYKQPETIVLLSSIAIARLIKNVNSDFYRYYLLSPQVQDLMRNNYVSGSAIPRVILKDFKKVPVPLIPPDTVLLSFKMTLGRVAITTEHMLSNEAIAHFKFNDKTPFTKKFLYFYLKTYPYETLGSTSSIVTSINSGMIKDMEVIIPDDETLFKFENLVTEYFDKIKSNQTQIRTLTALRDTLLPKLVSGEIRVDVDGVVETQCIASLQGNRSPQDVKTNHG